LDHQRKGMNLSFWEIY